MPRPPDGGPSSLDQEKRLLQKEETLDKKIATAEKREQESENRAQNLTKREKRIDEMEEEAKKAADAVVAEQRAKLERSPGSPPSRRSAT